MIAGIILSIHTHSFRKWPYIVTINRESFIRSKTMLRLETFINSLKSDSLENIEILFNNSLDKFLPYREANYVDTFKLIYLNSEI